jgi:hypothetical protein
MQEWLNWPLSKSGMPQGIRGSNPRLSAISEAPFDIVRSMLASSAKVLFIVGTTLTVSFAALSYEGGIIADATSSNGDTTPVEMSMLIIGFTLIVLSFVLYILSSRKSNR